jgi:hypothetical protein
MMSRTRQASHGGSSRRSHDSACCHARDSRSRLGTSAGACCHTEASERSRTFAGEQRLTRTGRVMMWGSDGGS